MLKLHSDCTVLNKEHIVRSELQIGRFTVWLVTIWLVLSLIHTFSKEFVQLSFSLSKQGICHMVKVNR